MLRENEDVNGGKGYGGRSLGQGRVKKNENNYESSLDYPTSASTRSLAASKLMQC